MLANRFHAPSDSIINMAVDYYRIHDISQISRLEQLREQLVASESPEDALVTALYFQKEKELWLYKERVARERYMMGGILLLLVAAVDRQLTLQQF